MDDPNDNTLTDMERYKDPDLFRLSRRIRKLSRRITQMERNWRNFVKEEVPRFAKSSAITTLRHEMDELKKANRALQSRIWKLVGAIVLMVIKWLLDQVHK